MTPVLEVGHARVSLSVQSVEVVDLAVVKQVGNDSRNVGSLNTCGDVLTVTATIGLPGRISTFDRKIHPNSLTRCEHSCSSWQSSWQYRQGSDSR